MYNEKLGHKHENDEEHVEVECDHEEEVKK